MVWFAGSSTLLANYARAFCSRRSGTCFILAQTTTRDVTQSHLNQGSSLVQLGKNIAGCKVVGVVGSSHKVQLVRDLGADHVIDKSKENLWRIIAL